MSENRWKEIALVSLGFMSGMAYVAACGNVGPNDAEAAEASDCDQWEVAVIEADFTEYPTTGDPRTISAGWEPLGFAPSDDLWVRRCAD